jgi:Family of unknown function (DUF6325)
MQRGLIGNRAVEQCLDGLHPCLEPLESREQRRAQTAAEADLVLIHPTSPLRTIVREIGVSRDHPGRVIPSSPRILRRGAATPGDRHARHLEGRVAHTDDQSHLSLEGDPVSEEHAEQMGPVDYMVLEWAGDQPVTGEVMPLLLDLVDRGMIRILDLAFIVKDPDGSVTAMDFAETAQESEGLADFEGASSGLLGQDDLEEAATAMEPGTVAAVLVWENRWAAPLAVALRRSGGQLVASGRIPVQALLASLDASEAIH